MELRDRKKLIGKEFLHEDHGKVRVTGLVDKSHTKIEAEVTFKGKGFNEKTQSFKGWRNRIGWMRGENREFGMNDIIRIDSLGNEIKETIKS